MNERGGTRNRYGRQEKCTQGALMENDHLEELGIDGRTILNCTFRRGRRRHGLVCPG